MFLSLGVCLYLLTRQEYPTTLWGVPPSVTNAQGITTGGEAKLYFDPDGQRAADVGYAEWMYIPEIGRWQAGVTVEPDILMILEAAVTGSSMRDGPGSYVEAAPRVVGGAGQLRMFRWKPSHATIESVDSAEREAR